MDFVNDDLGRQKFADLLVGYVARLAEATVLPAGRVLAVDAPWGSGKSWIAKRLPGHFELDNRIGKCVYIDAFEFDYHQDPFAVIASTIIDAYKGQSKEVASFKKAAKKVLATGVPAVAKSIVNVGFKAVGIDTDSLAEAIADGIGTASEKTIDAMLTTASQTSAITEVFKQKLAGLATTSPGNTPLVIVIDELDRCRPSYALELLERVKHLFDVPNVVFVLFVHTPAIHSAIRKTYGSEIDPSGYLRKFISVTIGLPISETPDYSAADHTNFFKKFLNAQYPLDSNSSSEKEKEFRESLVAFSSAFNASFRDIENVMLLWQLISEQSRPEPLFSAYSLLLKICDEKQLRKLRLKSALAFKEEAARLKADEDGRDHRFVTFMRTLLAYAANEKDYVNNPASWPYPNVIPIRDCQRAFAGFTRTIANLDLEYLRF